jgi:hypothetical protein
MNKFWIYLFLLLSTSTSAQLTLEHKYIVPPGGEAVFVANLGNSDYKYVMIDYYNNEFSLYNLDHSIYMSNIQLPLPSDSFALYQIGYITSTLFDCDSTNIEYALMTASPNNSEKFMIYRTDGTLLFSRDSVSVQYGYGYNVGSVEIHGIENTSAGAKLFLFNQNREIFVYGLCGVLPDEIKEISQSSNYVQLYPNPHSDEINFEITPPNHNESFELTVFDLAFQPITKLTISEFNTKIKLNNESLSSGTYFYSLQNKYKVFQTGKFILSK